MTERFCARIGLVSELYPQCLPALAALLVKENLRLGAVVTPSTYDTYFLNAEEYNVAGDPPADFETSYVAMFSVDGEGEGRVYVDRPGYDIDDDQQAEVYVELLKPDGGSEQRKLRYRDWTADGATWINMQAAAA